MHGLRLFQLRDLLTSYGLCVLVLCVVPFLLDVATCDEFYAASLHQPALVDGEEVDPSKDTADSFSPDHHFSSCLLLSCARADQEAAPASDRLSPPRAHALVALTSRPPPVV